MSTKPQLNFWQIWNMSFGFLGIQFGWGLQMGNMSAIYKFLGVQPDEVAFLWLAAPLTGLIVQPIIGALSDRTWTRLGRRKPYFLIGAILSSLALVAMPNSSVWWMAAGLLWVLDASINISMEPFRAFVADMLPERQRTRGFAMQSVFIGLGAVLASFLPIFLTNVLGIKGSDGGAIPIQVKISFYVGAFAFIGAVLWTVLSTKEYPPEDLEAFKAEKAKTGGLAGGFMEVIEAIGNMPKNMRRLSLVQFFTWLGLFLMWIYFFDVVAFNVFQAKDYPTEFTYYYNGAKAENFSKEYFDNPSAYLPAEQQHYILERYANMDALKGTVDAEFHSQEEFLSTYFDNNEKLSSALNWANMSFGWYSIITFFFGFALPWIARQFSRKWTHLLCLTAGGLGLISVMFIHTPWMLLIAMTGVGIAWTSILSLPYSLLSTSIPENKMGVYMGIFNFFIVLPEIISALFFGYFLNHVLSGQKVYAVAIGGACMILAGILTLRVKED